MRFQRWKRVSVLDGTAEGRAWVAKTGEDLVNLAGDGIGAEPRNARIAPVEMQRRLILALEESTRSANRAAWAMIALTVVIATLTTILVFDAL